MPGSAKANGREPKSCLGQVINFKLGRHSIMYAVGQHVQALLSLELKTRLRFHPVSLSLSMKMTSSSCLGVYEDFCLSTLSKITFTKM